MIEETCDEIKAGNIVYCVDSGSGVISGEYYKVQELTERYGGKFFVVKLVKNPKGGRGEEVNRTRFRMCTEAELSKLEKAKKPKKAKSRLEDLIL